MERLDGRLLANIKQRMHALKKCQEDADGHWGAEDMVYRFYHHSFKVYRIQGYTTDIVALFDSVDPKPMKHGKRDYNRQFEEIIAVGTGHTFEMDHNSDWARRARPMVEAYFHAKYMLDMMIKYGEELDEAPRMLPSGWASVLYIFNMR